MTVTIDNDLNAAAGGGTPGGSDTQVQFNDGGAFGGDAGLTYNKTTNVLTNTGGYIDNVQAVATTSTDGVVLETSSTATSGNQKYSPRLRLRGSGWKTDATAAAQPVDWSAEVVPVQGAAAPSANLVLGSAINGGAYTSNAIFTSAGSATVGNLNAQDTYLSLYKTNSTAVAQTIASRTHIFECSATPTVLTNSAGKFGFTSSTDGNDVGVTADTMLMRAAAANLRLGAAAANPPVAQTLSVQNSSGTDIAGATWTQIASLGTGAGVPGTMVFQTGATLGSGTTLQTATTRFTIAETRLTAAVPVVLPSYVAGSLPTGAAGMRAFCTDSNSTTFAAIVAGGGANGVPVYHDGTNWRIG